MKKKHNIVENVTQDKSAINACNISNKNINIYSSFRVYV